MHDHLISCEGVQFRKEIITWTIIQLINEFINQLISLFISDNNESCAELKS